MFEWFTFKILEILPNVQDLLKSSREFEDKNILGFLDILDSLLMILFLYVFFSIRAEYYCINIWTFTVTYFLWWFKYKLYFYCVKGNYFFENRWINDGVMLILAWIVRMVPVMQVCWILISNTYFFETVLRFGSPPHFMPPVNLLTIYWTLAQ